MQKFYDMLGLKKREAPRAGSRGPIRRDKSGALAEDQEKIKENSNVLDNSESSNNN